MPSAEQGRKSVKSMLLAAICLTAGATAQETSTVSAETIAGTKRHVLAKRPDQVKAVTEAIRYHVLPYSWALYKKPMTGVDTLNLCGWCDSKDMSLAYIFNGTLESQATVDFVPIEISELTTGEVTQTKTVTNLNTFTWKWETAVEVGAEFSYSPSSAVGGFGVKASVKTTAKGGEDRAKTSSVASALQTKYPCPENSLCQLQSWTFTSNYNGNYYEMPVFDFGCLEKPFHLRTSNHEWHVLKPKSHVSIASLVGVSTRWDAIAREYFTLRDRATQKEVLEAPVGGSEFLGIKFPPESVEILPKHISTRETATFPVLKDDGSPYTATVMVTYKLSSVALKKRGPEAPLTPEELGSEDVKVDILILESDIPGLQSNITLLV
ncbi:hypothetical protein NOR_06269 [Metarhizium rileyi]|uniref:Uncharacterized protein n=1 Tax=Metarhizium rileyi (strain RCEF 4871) TaxID=1649241 RepID=A0A167AXL0_METRR|nr:hypothetical protein NOR_06269 [Metarhizium rileyi RCEF 4871]